MTKTKISGRRVLNNILESTGGIFSPYAILGDDGSTYVETRTELRFSGDNGINGGQIVYDYPYSKKSSLYKKSLRLTGNNKFNSAVKKILNLPEWFSDSFKGGKILEKGYRKNCKKSIRNNLPYRIRIQIR